MSKDFSGLGKTDEASAYGKYKRIDDSEQKDIRKALALMQQGNHEGAELIYKRLIEKGTKEYVVFGNLAVICYMKKRIKEMIVLLKEALRLNPNYPEGLTNLGFALQKQVDLPGAIQLYKKALAIKPDFLNALLNLSGALKEQGELNEAIEYYKKVLAIDPQSLVALNNLGAALAEQGEWQEAIKYYKRALAIGPQSLVALNSLGAALKEQGELQKAIEYYKKALAIDPNCLAVLNNMGIALKEQGELQEAIHYYKKALAIDPNCLAVLHNLGITLKEQGELQEAIHYYKKALAIDPNSLAVLYNLGIALKQQGELQAAIEYYEKALAIDPNYVPVLNVLGAILAEQRKLQEAIKYYKKALAIDPNYLLALNNLGLALVDQEKVQEAIHYYKKALAIDPKYLIVLNNLGIALKQQGKVQEAIHYYRKALAIDPNYVLVLNNLGISLVDQGDLQESITLYQKAIFLKEDYPDAHFNLSFTLLLSGDYENGWKEYEWRLHNKRRLHAHPQLKRWDDYNNSSENKLILVSEQGFGDTLQFIRYIPYLINRGMVVAFCTKTKFHGLIQASDITTEIYSLEEIHQVTTGEWLPLLSLPRYLNVRPDNPLVNESYIKAPKERILFWKQKLSSEKRPIIGICWQGNPNTEKNCSNLGGRSFPLQTFAPIIENRDASLLSLQKGFGSEQLTDCRFLDRFVGCQEEINQTWDFVENAAIMMNCDLIITVDTVVAHLAGGLGQPTWLLLHKVPDWRWGMEGDTTFWYPSMRLFRQREHGNWPEVMDRVASALEMVFSDRTETFIMDRTDSPRNVSSIMVPIAFAELIDKITILQIKSERFKGESKQNVDHELNLLQQALRQSGVELLSEHHQQLKSVNESLWQIEEDIRSHEAEQTFGEAFVQLARSVYLQNDKRAGIKRMINDYYGSDIIEEKSYHSL